MKLSLDDMQRFVGEWGSRTFPQSNIHSIVSHFAEEAEEFVRGERGVELACDGYAPEQVDAEAADCFLLLLHYCHRRGVSLYDLAEAKMKVNTARNWDSGEGRGYAKHVEVTP